MYKKIALLALIFSSLTHTTSDMVPWFEIKPSYFFFAASPLNDIYDDGGFEIQGSVSVPVYECLDLYGSIGLRKAWGHACNSGEKTNLTVVPFDFGIKPIITFCENLSYFFAIGPRFFYFNQHNHSPYVDCTINSGGVGLFLNTGFNALLADCLLAGIFGEYSYEKKKICPTRPNVLSNGKVQLGGFAFGVSLGYEF